MSGDGSPPGPIADHFTNLRVAVIMRLIPGTTTVRAQYEQGLVVQVRAIDCSEVKHPGAVPTVTDWLRVVVSEMTNSGTLRKKAESVLARLTADEKGWPVGTRSVMMYKRAATVRARHTYLVEEDYF